MSDAEFLQWIYDRLVHVHCEKTSIDYMCKLRQIIDKNRGIKTVAIRKELLSDVLIDLESGMFSNPCLDDIDEIKKILKQC